MPTVLQGKNKTVMDYLTTQDDASLTADELLYKKNYFDRFQNHIFPSYQNIPIFIKKLLAIYQEYWFDVLTALRKEEEAQLILLTTLIDLINDYHSSQTMGIPWPLENIHVISQVEEVIQVIANQLGYYILMGITRPYAELILWEKQIEQNFSVDLDEGNIHVSIIFLENFLSRGWLAFATLDRMKAGGWATKEHIYQTVPKPTNVEDEQFKIDILYHEGRHFSDYKLFPSLKQGELEYRAKLTELVYAIDSLYDRIKNFLSSAQDNPAIPHSFAAYHVICSLSKEIFAKNYQENVDEWNKLSKDSIHHMAQFVHTRNNHLLKNNNPEKIETFL